MSLSIYRSDSPNPQIPKKINFSFLACALELVQGPRGIEEIAKPDLWDALARLALDRVVDVRIGVGRLVASACGAFNPVTAPPV